MTSTPLYKYNGIVWQPGKQARIKGTDYAGTIRSIFPSAVASETLVTLENPARDQYPRVVAIDKLESVK